MAADDESLSGMRYVEGSAQIVEHRDLVHTLLADRRQRVDPRVLGDVEAQRAEEHDVVDERGDVDRF